MVVRWRRLLRLAGYLMANEERLINDLLAAKIAGTPVAWLHGNALQGLFALLVRGRS